MFSKLIRFFLELQISKNIGWQYLSAFHIKIEISQHHNYIKVWVYYQYHCSIFVGSFNVCVCVWFSGAVLSLAMGEEGESCFSGGLDGTVRAGRFQTLMWILTTTMASLPNTAFAMWLKTVVNTIYCSPLEGADYKWIGHN